MNDDNGIIKYRRRLPHWYLPGAVHFVTWRVHRQSPTLTGPERGLVLDVVRRLDGVEYRLGPVVIMDDHAHALVTPIESVTLEDVVQGWKSVAAHELSEVRRCAEEAIWQRESFDRVMRDDGEIAVRDNYIAGNPWKRWPGLKGYPWVWRP